MLIEKLKKYNIFQEEILSLELLKNQGFNNISYLLKTTTKSYVLRLFKSNESVNISRNFEFEILKKIHKLNLTSKPIFLNENFMIYEFIKGFHKTKLSNLEIKKVALNIKKYHKIKPKLKSYDIKQDLKNYNNSLSDFKSKKILNQSFRALNFVKKYKKDLVLTHHDLNPKNIIFFKHNIKIIDWEYSGINDRFFDLASFCVEFNLNKKDEKIVLKNYFFKYSKNEEKKLKYFKIIYKNLCELWFMKNLF